VFIDQCITRQNSRQKVVLGIAPLRKFLKSRNRGCHSRISSAIEKMKPLIHVIPKISWNAIHFDEFKNACNTASGTKVRIWDHYLVDEGTPLLFWQHCKRRLFPSSVVIDRTPTRTSKAVSFLGQQCNPWTSRVWACTRHQLCAAGCDAPLHQGTVHRV
jgi:hypothetical protein